VRAKQHSSTRTPAIAGRRPGEPGYAGAIMRLRVLTLNVWDLPFGLARDARWRVAGLAALPALDADVVALQEVWTGAGRRILVDALRAAGYAHVWHRRRALGGSGLLLAARMPLTDVAFHPFEAAGLPQRVQHADWYGGKGFAVARLAGAGQPATVVVTHLHAGYVAPGEPDEYVGVRTAQILQLADRIAAVDTPLVLAGDLNLHDDEPEYAVLLGTTGLVDVAAALDRRDPTVLAPHPYRGPGAVAQRIDYVLARAGAGRAVVAESIERVLDEPVTRSDRTGPLSDHAGLLATLRVAPGRGVGAPGPPDPAVLDLARRRLAEGRRIAIRRVGREARGATAAGLVGAGLLALGRSADRGAPERRAARATRRGFLGGLGRALSGAGALALGGGAAAGLVALWAARAERAGHEAALRRIDALEARARDDAARRDTLPGP
jgi:endonuclease/exonuclease/phosphatase family metal-dependent hydrolase